MSKSRRKPLRSNPHNKNEEESLIVLLLIGAGIFVLVQQMNMGAASPVNVWLANQSSNPLAALVKNFGDTVNQIFSGQS